MNLTLTILAIAIIIGIIGGLVYTPDTDKGDKIDCYDERGNRIIGVMCEEQQGIVDRKIAAGLGLFIVSFIFVFLTTMAIKMVRDIVRDREANRV